MRCCRFSLAAQLITAALLVCLLCSCGGNTSSAPVQPEVTEQPTALPDPTPVPTVRLGGVTYTALTETVDVSGGDVTYDELCQAAEVLENVKSLALGQTDFDRSQLDSLADIYPEAEITWSVELLGKTFSNDTETVDLAEITAEDVPIVCRKLTLLPRLRTVMLFAAWIIPQSAALKETSSFSAI